MCKYCEDAVPLVIGETNDYGICIGNDNVLYAYGYDVHGSGSNGLSVKIKYCPICARELPERNKRRNV